MRKDPAKKPYEAVIKRFDRIEMMIWCCMGFIIGFTLSVIANIIL
jgi:hypothetical protein